MTVKQLVANGVPRTIAECIRQHGGHKLEWARRGVTWWCRGTDTLVGLGVEVQANRSLLIASHYAENQMRSRITIESGTKSEQLANIIRQIRSEHGRSKELTRP